MVKNDTEVINSIDHLKKKLKIIYFSNNSMKAMVRKDTEVMVRNIAATVMEEVMVRNMAAMVMAEVGIE
jgi:hypothetical protein